MMKSLRKTLLLDEHVCPWWLAYAFDNPLRRLIHRPVELFKPYLNEGDVAIDVGCGMGVNSIAMAKSVGESGKVIAVDVQQQMLDILMSRAHKKGIAHRIQVHKCAPNKIGLREQGDFILTFWMVHETRSVDHLIQQIYDLLRPGGKFLLVEPKLHVSREQYEQVLHIARQIGFQLMEQPKIWLSRAALFNR